MNKLIKQFIYIWSIVVIAVFTGCSDDIDPLVTSVEGSRLFSPVNLTASTVNRTSVRLTWKSVEHAQSYHIEFYANGTDDYSGTPVKTISGVTYSQVPYTVSGFDGSTTYSVRVQAVSSTIAESKWSGAQFTTASEQLFLPAEPGDIGVTEVTLRWTAGETVTEIALAPGDIRHTLSADEITAGIAVITGLNSNTDYTARLMNGEKARDSFSFRTLIDLGGATAVYPDDDIKKILEDAEDGAVIVLMVEDGRNEFFYKNETTGEVETLELTLTKSVTIKGYNEKPKFGARFILDGCNNFTLDNIDLEGTGNIITVVNSIGGEIQVTNCTATKFGTFLIETDNTVTGTISKVTVDNCIFYDMASGKRFVDYQKKKSFITTFTLKNSTICNSCSSSDFIRFDRHSLSGNIVNLQNCTLYGVEATSKGLLYIRSNSAGDKQFTANVTRCLFANMGEGVFFSQDTKTDNVIFTTNYYNNAPSLLTNPTGGAGKVFDTSGQEIDPGFADPANGNFTVSNETLKEKNIGDPRWLK